MSQWCAWIDTFLNVADGVIALKMQICAWNYVDDVCRSDVIDDENRNEIWVLAQKVVALMIVKQAFYVLVL
ncbi:hypothetical protein NDU88_010458 [Pleurodeles waltl]|uniref:Uncharacterized protein n=1 Tax=Pleurodeles waltl TaxID=8319 RepID=A0AAV7QUF7_PLEWA|nr:hypothetical protein NDU88_010458 [Pleurodeles waltl]